MKIMGHRGAKGEYPENTIKSIQHAISSGVDAIEIDVHLSKDAQLVVVHDDSVDRTTNGKGKIKEMTLNELQSLDAGEGEKIPTLQEVIDIVKETTVDFFIEIKALGCEQLVVDHILNNNLTNQAIVICFNHRVILKIKEIESKIKTTCLLYGLPVDPVNIVRSCKADGISISVHTIDETLVAECHKEGLLVTAWNVNEKQQKSFFEKIGVDYLGTDFPSVICNN